MWYPFGNCKPGLRTISPPLIAFHLHIIWWWTYINIYDFTKLLNSFKNNLLIRSSNYLYFVTKQWRKTAICSFAKSAPTHTLNPPPNTMNFLDATCVSTPYIVQTIYYTPFVSLCMLQQFAWLKFENEVDRLASHRDGLNSSGCLYVFGSKWTVGGHTITAQPAGIIYSANYTI